MTIHDLVRLAEAVHNREGYNLGSSSTREYRNAFWARVLGCVHHGHPIYNPAPDPRWHLKREPGGPQSDDVAAFLPSRDAWDCIPGAGADGYRFEADYLGVLQPQQVTYVPPIPADTGVPDPELPPPTGPSTFDYPDENTAVKTFQDRVKQAYADAKRQFPDPNDQDAYRHFARYGYDCHSMPEPEAANKRIAELRAQLGV